MQNQKLQFINHIKNFINKYKIIENVILFGSIVSVNFVAYISYFDINTFMFIDSSTIIKHTFRMMILFAFVSASIMILMLLLQNIFLVKHDSILFFPIIYVDDPNKSKLYKILKNKYLRYFISIIVFSYLYIGGKNTIYVLLSFLVFSIFIFIIDILIAYREKPVQAEKSIINDLEKIKYYSKLPDFLQTALKRAYEYDYILQQEISIIYNNGKSFQLILSRVGIMLITLSLLFGIGKANYVESNTLVNVKTNTNHNDNNLTLFLTTENGICLFSSEKNNIIFRPWSSITNIDFVSENSHNLRSLLFKRQQHFRANKKP
jgi:hypothetical protein